MTPPQTLAGTEHYGCIWYMSQVKLTETQTPHPQPAPGLHGVHEGEDMVQCWACRLHRLSWPSRCACPSFGMAVGLEAVGVLGPGVGSKDGNGGGTMGGPSFT